MVCEKCAAEIETFVCAHCGASVIRLGPYCYLCGRMFEVEEDKAEHSDDEIDLSARILCSDEACIGVVNEQGVCKVCGKPYVPEPKE